LTGRSEGGSCKMPGSVPIHTTVATCSVARKSVPFQFGVAILSLLMMSCSKSKVEPLSQAAPERNYTLGKRIIFGENGDSEKFRVSGWSHTEKEFTWTEGPAAVLQFTGLPTSTSFRLKMTLAALTSPSQLPSQPVQVFANGRNVAEWQVEGKGEFTALIPSQGDTSTLTLEFKVPKATSPQQLGMNLDSRMLGVCCFDMLIMKVE
jgi:hypothetical protein